MTHLHGVTGKTAYGGEAEARLPGGSDERFGLIEVTGDEIARLILAEKLRRIAAINANTDAARNGHFKGRQRKPAIGQIGTGSDPVTVRANERAMSFFCLKIDDRSIAILAIKDLFEER